MASNENQQELFWILMLFLYLCEQTTGVHVPKPTFSLDTTDVFNQPIYKKIHSRRRGLIPNSRRRGDAYSQLYQKAQSKILWDRIIQKHKSRARIQQHTADRLKSGQLPLAITNITKQQVADFTLNKTRVLKPKAEKMTSNTGEVTPNAEKVTNNTGEVTSNAGEVTRNTENVTPNAEKVTPHAEKVTPNAGEVKTNAGEGSLVKRHKRWDYDENYDWENGGKDYVIPGEERKETKFEKFAKSWQKHALKAIFLFSVVCMLLCCCLAICKKFCSKVCETICWHLRDYREIFLNRDPSFRNARKFADDYGIELDYDQYTKIKRNYQEGFRRGGHDKYKDLSGR